MHVSRSDFCYNNNNVYGLWTNLASTQCIFLQVSYLKFLLCSMLLNKRSRWWILFSEERTRCLHNRECIREMTKPRKMVARVFRIGAADFKNRKLDYCPSCHWATSAAFLGRPIRRVGGRGCAFPVTLQKKPLNFKKINQQSGRLS